MIGAAFTWLFGSRSILNASQWVGGMPGRVLPWLLIPALFVVASFLLICISILTNFSHQFVIGGMLILGLLISPFSSLTVSKPVLRVFSWVGLFLVFFIASVPFSLIDSRSAQNAEKIGELDVSGFCALLVGMFWLVKGKTLVLRGVEPQLSSEAMPLELEGDAGPQETSRPAGKSFKTIWTYSLLLIGFTVFTIWTGVIIFVAVGDLISPIGSSDKNQGYMQAGFFMLLAWWPYAAWKEILRREPNRIDTNVRKHRHISAGAGIVFAVLMSTAVVFAVQRGTERKLALDFKEKGDDFWKITNQIGNIKGRELKTVEAYVGAYDEISQLEESFDNGLKNFEAARQALKTYRGPFDLSRPNSVEAQADGYSILFELMKKSGEVNRKQFAVINDLKMLPVGQQPDFWREHFYPLLIEQDSIRKRLLAAGSTSSQSQ